MIGSLSINFFIRTTGPILTYIILLLNGRYIDNSTLGNIILGISITNIIQSFASMGFSPLVIRNITSEFSIKKSNIFKILLTFQTLLILMLFIIISKIYNLSFYFILVSIPLIAGSYQCLKIRSFNKITIYNLLQSLCIPVTQALLLLLYVNFFILSAKQYLFILFLPYLFIAWLVSLNEKRNLIQKKIKFSDLKILFSSSLIIGISGIIASLNTNIDNVMISKFCGLNCLPEYKMHSIITLIGLLLSSTYCIQIGNDFSKLYQSGNKSKFINLLKKGIKYNFLYHTISIPVCFLILPSLTKYISINYSLSNTLILYFTTTGLVLSSVNIIIVGAIQIGLERKIVVFNILALLTNIFLNYKLIPIYGLYGAAFGTLIGSLVSLVLCFNVLNKKIYG